MKRFAFFVISNLLVCSSLQAQDAVVVPRIADSISGRPGGTSVNIVKLDNPANRTTSGFGNTLTGPIAADAYRNASATVDQVVVAGIDGIGIHVVDETPGFLDVLNADSIVTYLPGTANPPSAHDLAVGDIAGDGGADPDLVIIGVDGGSPFLRVVEGSVVGAPGHRAKERQLDGRWSKARRRWVPVCDG